MIHSGSRERGYVVPTEKRIDATDLMQGVGHILGEIYQHGVVYVVEVDADSVVALGPETICGPALGLVDSEYGWPTPIQVEDIKSVWDICPQQMRHPFICRGGVCLAVSIRVWEYESIKSKARGAG